MSRVSAYLSGRLRVSQFHGLGFVRNERPRGTASHLVSPASFQYSYDRFEIALALGFQYHLVDCGREESCVQRRRRLQGWVACIQKGPLNQLSRSMTISKLGHRRKATGRTPIPRIIQGILCGYTLTVNVAVMINEEVRRGMQSGESYVVDW
jgi:hypothetical protein